MNSSRAFLYALDAPATHKNPPTHPLAISMEEALKGNSHKSVHFQVAPESSCQTMSTSLRLLLLFARTRTTATASNSIRYTDSSLRINGEWAGLDGGLRLRGCLYKCTVFISEKRLGAVGNFISVGGTHCGRMMD